VSEQLKHVPTHFKVIRHVRPKLACVSCQAIFQAEAQSLPFARDMAGPGLLTQVMVSEYCDDLPLYRQSASTLAKACTSTARRWSAGWTRATRCSTRWWQRSAKI
jgi:transposase